MPPKKFEYLPHTADMRFVAHGRSFKEAFENAGLALLSTMLDIRAIGRIKGADKTVRLTERAGTREDLVWYVLQDILSKVDERKLNAYRFKINSLEKRKDRIVLHGCIFYKQVREDHALLSVKAVTPHDLRVKESKGRCSVSVVVDV
jgi:SHS2 domain-containing protein